MSTYRARLKPSGPRVNHHTGGITFEREKGWYPVSEEQAKYLAEQPLHEGDPYGAKLFDAVTTEQAVAMDKASKPGQRHGTARNPVDIRNGEAPLTFEDLPEEVRARLDDADRRVSASEAKSDQMGALLAAIATKMGIDLSTFTGAAPPPSGSEPVPKNQGTAKDAVPAKPQRPGSAPRKDPATGGQHNPPTDDKPAVESPASES